MHLALKKILVPVSSLDEAESDLAKEAVEAARDLAKATGAKLHIITVVPPTVPVTGPDFSGEIYKSLLEVRNAQIGAAKELLEGLRKEAASEGVGATIHVLDGAESVPDQICKHAKDESCDLIAISSHGRRGISRLLLGSVAERVAHLAPVPVLLLRPQHKD